MRGTTLLLTCLVCSASARAQDLAQIGPYPVGYWSAMLVGSSGRPIHLMIFYPAEIDGSSWPEAEIDQVVIPTVRELPFKIPARHFAQFVDGRVVYARPPHAAGRFPAVIHLPGAGSPGVLHTGEAIRFASHGVVFAAVTHYFGSFCEQQLDWLDARDALSTWSRTPAHLLEGAVGEDAVFCSGWSRGGRNCLALASAVPECGRPSAAGLIKGVILKDAFSPTLTLDQLQNSHVATLQHSQACSANQIALQQQLGSNPIQLAYTGIDVPGPTDRNHTLFAQGCMHFMANLSAGFPVVQNLMPSVAAFLLANCLPDGPYTLLEAAMARVTTRYGLAFIRRELGDGAYAALLAPGRVTEPGVDLVRSAVGEGGDPAPEGFCSLEGGGNPLVQF